MLAQAARWKAKNSPLRRAPGNSELSSFRLCVTNQPAAFSFAERNARIMQSHCGREEGMGEAAFRTTFSGACHSVCQQPGGFFPGKKGRLSRPCPMAALREQHGAVWTTTALFGLCTLLSAAEPGPSQGLLGIPGRQRLDREAPLLPQGHPGHCQGGGGHWRA